MLSENEYGWQTIRKNTKRINIWRDWHYKAIGTPYTYRTYPNIIESSSCIYTIPNETSVITIQTLTTDDDGHSNSRLVPNDSIVFGIQYTTTTSNGSANIQMDIVKLNTKKRYKINDGQGVRYVYVINIGFYLSNISNYKDIRVFSVWIGQVGGIIKGNETSVLVNYTQDIF